MTTVLQRVFGVVVALGSVTMAMQAWSAESEISPKLDITLTPGESCLSSSCHADIGKKKYVHPEAENGNKCTGCHQALDPARHDFSLPAKKGDLCANCHDLNVAGEKLHGPVAAGQCLRCHDPHASDYRKLVKAALPDLCFDCHDKAVKGADDKYMPSTKAAFENRELAQHRPFERGKCSTCHESHSSPNTRLLKRTYPESFYAAYTKKTYFCFRCHKEKAFREPRTLTDTAFRNGNLNLHYRHVNKEKGRTCRACHHHHAAGDPKLIRKSVPFGQRFIFIEDFELTESGGSCGPTCHLAVNYDRLEPVENGLRVTPREGEDASYEELLDSQPNQP